ncbi:altronate dehydratase, partial [Burkholderia gladioli]|nr:altronate dehydratase [Burkholderia gladioli]
MKDRDLIALHDDDNVAVAMRALEADARLELNGRALRIRSPIPAGHKLAVRDIAHGGRRHQNGAP